ncbi:FecR family protein [Parabacteroides sp. PF5-6]|uniref:FecR family protein n=1 Tax=Parabacteroides sp. PF5-6 TaxID=1742403 RepID=UPI002405D9D3|nr:FecR family protein [Parabacteroides sp. PF5-6]MDF9830274.1 ferric-dicitrate binding protein FerR (iron transport regulator) [Parabacteroides sp. PF5-6]
MKNEEQIARYKSLLEDEMIFHALLDLLAGDNTLLKQMKQDNPEKEQDIKDLQQAFGRLKIVEKELSAYDKARLWDRIEAERKRGRSLRMIRNVLKYAAVLILVLASSLYFLWEKTAVEIPVDYESILSEMALAEDSVQNVLLVFSNEQKIEMTDQNVELEYDAEGNISVNSSRIENIASSDEHTIGYNRLYVPYGKTMQVSMSDGTKVWVNSGSRLIYPESFSGNKREIYLEGEIYLEVARNEKVPFVVKTSQMVVEVLGTAFNVSAYRNDEIQSVVLANGSVAIKNKISDTPTVIKPNQRYTLTQSTNEIHLDTVDVFYYICWKYNLIMSESESLSAILKKLERYYNVQITYNSNEIDPIQVKGKLDLKNTIEETLHVISLTTPINYSVENESIKLNVKP